MARKRSDFEHKLNARGSQPSDYARYAEYEMNLESLRRKRIRRLGVKASSHTGQRRIFFVLDRGTRKFHGDIALWMQYIDYARKERAHRKLSQIFTAVLRLHPIKPELWICAATYAIDIHADMTEARSYMQRGLRFCNSSKLLWLEYARLEMLYLAKITARRQMLGLDEDRSKIEKLVGDDNNGEDVIALPDITQEGINPGSEEDDDAADQVALRQISTTPALSGAIPLAIFDAAMKQFPGDNTLGETFFDLFVDFANVPYVSSMLQHVVQSMLAATPAEPSPLGCFIRQPLVGVEPTSGDFPAALGVAVGRVKSSLEKTSLKATLAERIVNWLLSIAQIDGLDPGIQKVVLVVLAQTIRAFEDAAAYDSSIGEDDFLKLMSKLSKAGRSNDARLLLSRGLKLWPSSDGLRSFDRHETPGR